MSTSETLRAPSGVPVLHVCTPDGRVFRFVQTFHVGREQDCELRLQNPKVSRRHLEVSFHGGHWHVRDLKSANGIYVNGQRVETARVDDALTLTLGIDGPSLLFELNPQPRRTPAAAAATVQSAGDETKLLRSYEERYFGSGAVPGQVGGRTLMIRKAFEKVQKKQQRRHLWSVGVVLLIAVAAGAYALYKHRQVKQQQAAAQLFFYEMKSLDVAIANIEKMLAESGDERIKDQIQSQRARRRQMESTYDNYLKVLNLYDRNLSEEDRLILKVTRLFGECELAAPPDYMRQVKSYIQKWKGSQRFANAVRAASQNGYTARIAEEFMQHNLPPQFFYLAMQESDFDAFASGPPTRMGIAKGMWQFIPDTGSRYGLKIGPLAGMARADFADDRHDWQKATRAAARYIKDIYATDAQASGLLVMASYNWGEGRVINLLRSMPSNPAERNFWRVLERYYTRVPDQTYDYVFYIVSAAVIGENPRLFGFDFDNPLGFTEKQ